MCLLIINDCSILKKEKRAIVLLDHVNSCQLFVYLFFMIYLVFSQQQQLILKLLKEQNLEIKKQLIFVKQKTKQQKLNCKINKSSQNQTFKPVSTCNVFKERKNENFMMPLLLTSCRRTLATRERSIYNMRIEPTKGLWFTLHLSTQAGTYPCPAHLPPPIHRRHHCSGCWM